MAEVQTNVYAFIGNIRLSQYLNSLTGATGARNTVPGGSIESGREWTEPGMWDDSGSFTGYDQVDAEIATLRDMYGGVTAGPHLWTHAHGATLGDSATVDRVEISSLRIYRENGQPRFDMDFDLQDAHGLHSGFVGYSDIGGAGITGAVNGGNNTISGGIPAGSQLKINLHPYNHTGAAGTLDCLWEHATDSGFTVGVTTGHTFTQISSATRLPEQAVVAAPITNTFHRLRVTAVSAGTWFLFVSYVVETNV